MIMPAEHPFQPTILHRRFKEMRLPIGYSEILIFLSDASMLINDTVVSQLHLLISFFELRRRHMKKGHCRHFSLIQLLHAPHCLILMNAIKAAVKPAFSIHIRIQQDQWQEKFPLSIYQIQHKIPHAGNRSLASFISAFGKDRVFARGKNVRKLLLIAGRPHLTIMIPKYKCIRDLKTIQKFQQLLRLLSIIHRSAFREKRKHRISRQH